MSFSHIKNYLIEKYWDWTDVRWQQFPGHRILKDIRWILQKIFRGYSDIDLWNLDNHLTVIVLKRLRAFKEMKRSGCPAEIHCQEDWEKILDDMIRGFECHLIAEDCDSNFTIEKYEEFQRDINLGLGLFTKYFQCLWD